MRRIYAILDMIIGCGVYAGRCCLPASRSLYPTEKYHDSYTVSDSKAEGYHQFRFRSFLGLTEPNVSSPDLVTIPFLRRRPQVR